MNRTKLKNYAPQARRDFIQAVTDRAAMYGLTKDHVEPITEQGDVVIILGKPFPRSLAAKRNQLEERVHRHGFQQVMEAMAYTWFNRFVAIRFMELHGYFDHGYRVLSHSDPAKTVPEILEHAEHVNLPDLDKNKVIDLKLDGTKDSELYQMILIAQCNALSKAMPFLFERIDDDTELLLPDNLLNSDSLIRKLVTEIEENDWQEVEIIGWLYQFYISEKKDQVIGKVVKSEDIPAATQLFTPNWIVKYLVQNSLGRQWVATYPDSPLRKKMEFYIEPAEQTPEVQAQLATITPKSLNPEELTLMDPACGSGHILVEGYDLLKEIYLERGYRLRDIPSLILTKNVYGLEIDDRAAQLAAFALMMKARADDRRIFDGDVQPNVFPIQESNGLPINAVVQAFTSKKVTDESFVTPGELGFMAAVRAPLFAEENRPVAADEEEVAGDLKAVLELFKDAKTYGSLITVPQELASRLPDLADAVGTALADSNLMIQQAAAVACGFVNLASLLAKRFDAVVANPPYMGRGYFSPTLKAFTSQEYKDAKADLYSCFIQRNAIFAKPSGFVGMITIPNWMFLSSFEDIRKSLFHQRTIDTFIHNGRGVFGSDFGTCSFVFRNQSVFDYRGCYRRLFDKQGSVASNEELEQRFETTKTFTPSNANFMKIPGSPIAYWVPVPIVALFSLPRMDHYLRSDGQLLTGNNARFLRTLWEVSYPKIGAASAWKLHHKGGAFRRWYGNVEWVVAWDQQSREFFRKDRTARLPKEELWDLEGVTWTTVSSSITAFRRVKSEESFNKASPTLIASNSETVYLALASLNSVISSYLIGVLNPTVNCLVQDIEQLPMLSDVRQRQRLIELAKACCDISENEWNQNETAFAFSSLPLIPRQLGSPAALSESLECWAVEAKSRIEELRALEEEINRILIDAHGLQGAFVPQVPDGQITLYHPDRENDTERLLSYAMGCTMGRYSLDKPGLIYANSGNEGFDPRQYKTFPADKHGIVPVTDVDWFSEDATNRFVEFVSVAWSKENFEENLKFVADSLGAKSDEQPRETIRRYFADDFFKDHLKTYKRRPIYWLFTSGNLGAFQCLVYLHRYNEGTLSRMRTEYVIPLQGKVAARLEQIGGKDGESGDIATATSVAHKKKLGKEYELLKKHQVELAHFDEKLRHYADLRIKLDLDDGVKVNYGKFGDLLACVTQVCGKAEDDE
jgi:hypothetical protein